MDAARRAQKLRPERHRRVDGESFSSQSARRPLPRVDPNKEPDPVSLRTLQPFTLLAFLVVSGCIAEVGASEVAEELATTSAALTATENVPLYLRHLTLHR